MNSRPSGAVENETAQMRPSRGLQSLESRNNDLRSAQPVLRFLLERPASWFGTIQGGMQRLARWRSRISRNSIVHAHNGMNVPIRIRFGIYELH
jgi:hypothetical protein